MADPSETPQAGADEVLTLPLGEEVARLARRSVETGRVRVRLRTEVEEVPVAAALKREAVEVERIAIGRELAAGEPVPGTREEEDGAVLVVPVFEEVLVVETRLVLAEELRIRRRVGTETAATTVALRRQRAEVERLPAQGAGATAAEGGAEAILSPGEIPQENER